MNDALLTERRDLVIDRLSSDFARGAFEVDELERRLALAHAASSPTELDALVPSSSVALVPARRMRIVFGSVEHAGAWTVPRQLAARVVCGNLVIDLRDARLAAGETTIELNVTLGNVEVIVPPEVAVTVEATSFLGNIEARTEPATYATSSVRVVGRVKLGNLELATRRPGEARHGWRSRRRLRCGATRALGAAPSRAR